MGSVTVRLPNEAREALRTLAHDMDLPMQDVLVKAIDSYRRQILLEQLNEDYAALREDPVAWREVLEERAEWDATLLDGLQDD